MGEVITSEITCQIGVPDCKAHHEGLHAQRRQDDADDVQDRAFGAQFAEALAQHEGQGKHQRDGILPEGVGLCLEPQAAKSALEVMTKVMALTVAKQMPASTM